MFQQIFQQQAASLFLWPIAALGLFLFAFCLQLFAIFSTRNTVHEAQAASILELHDEVNHG